MCDMIYTPSMRTVKISIEYDLAPIRVGEAIECAPGATMEIPAPPKHVQLEMPIETAGLLGPAVFTFLLALQQEATRPTWIYQPDAEKP